MVPKIENIVKLFEYYQDLGIRTIEQIPDLKLFWQYNETSNSIAIIVNHLSGNMCSRFTNFFTEDGEKIWRKRDSEFESNIKTRKELILKWNEGWKCLFETLNQIEDKDLERIVYIRNMGHTVQDALNRQLAHYAYHIGQIVFIGKMIQDDNWKSLSIPKGKSQEYNSLKFSKKKQDKYFTDDL